VIFIIVKAKIVTVGLRFSESKSLSLSSSIS